MKKILLVTFPLMALCLTPPVVAQNTYDSANPMPSSGMGPSTSTKPSQQDRNFVEAAAMGGLAEVEAGKLAEEKASKKDVRKFGEHMAKDHKRANRRLESLAKNLDIPFPSELDADHNMMMDRLKQAEKKNFDTLYMEGQVQDHQKMVNLLEMEIGSGQNEELKKYASDILPAVQEHLKMANKLANDLRM